MSSTSELVIVGVVVAVALVWAGRAVLLSLRKTGGCSSCASSGECPLVQDPEAPVSLVDLSTDCEQKDSMEPTAR